MGNKHSTKEDLIKNRIWKLHRLVSDGDHNGLRKALSRTRGNIGYIHGISLYHTLVVGVAYNEHWHVSNNIHLMFEVLRDYNKRIGDVTRQSTQNGDIMVYSHKKKGNLNSCTTLLFVDDKGIETGFLNEEIHIPNKHTAHKHTINRLSPLVLALNIKRSTRNKKRIRRLKMAIELLKDIEREQIVFHHKHECSSDQYDDLIFTTDHI